MLSYNYEAAGKLKRIEETLAYVPGYLTCIYLRQLRVYREVELILISILVRH